MSGSLVIIQGTNKGAVFSLDNPPVLIGSGSGCAVKIGDENINNEHAVIEVEHGSWRLRATDPSTPIEIEGRMLPEMRIDHGTTFLLGRTRFKFLTPRAVIEAAPIEGETFDDREQAVARLSLARKAIMDEISKVIIGQTRVISQVLTALFARGHCLLIGAPGLAKTLIVRTLAGTLNLDSKRIQFTPDLMPADITGTDILEEDMNTGRRRFRFNCGPLFTNMLLADEINRTPPKTQASLLEAMQEQRVTASGITYDLPRPFLVLATQNPIELEGTYPLPEAQLDRFMFSVLVNYPEPAEEPQIIMETTRNKALEVERLMDAETILRYQNLVRQVPVSKHVAAYASALVRATRPKTDESPDFVSRWVRWGAGPRAGQFLLLAAKSNALLNNSFNVSCNDIREFAHPVLRHRIFTNFTAASEGVSADDIVTKILAQVEEPKYIKSDA